MMAQLDYKLVDLTPFTSDNENRDNEPPGQKTDSTVLIDPAVLEQMRSLDADISLDIKQLYTVDRELDDLQTTVSLNKGKLHIKPLS